MCQCHHTLCRNVYAYLPLIVNERMYVCRASMRMRMYEYVYLCICVCRAFMGICMSCVRAYVCVSCVRAWCMSCHVFIHVHVCCSFMCMRMGMCVLVYVCAGACEHVAHSCVCRAFVGMPCVNVYLYTK